MLVPCLKFKTNRVYKDEEIYFIPISGKGNVWTIVIVDDNKMKHDIVFPIFKMYEELSEEDGMSKKLTYL